MALCNGMIRIIWELSATDNVAPLNAHSVASLHVDDLGRNRRLVVRVAGDVGSIYILNRVV
jgi:hypothetical protein